MSEITKLQVDSIQVLCAHDYNASQLQTLLNNKKQGRNWPEIIFVAETESQIVGFSALSLIDPNINAIFVAPAFVRQGIGTKLLTVLEDEAIKRRIRCLWVSAALNAVQFYRSQGYQNVKEVTISLGIGVPIPVIVMKKVLILPNRIEIIITWVMYVLLMLFFLLAIILPLLFGN
ncbi:GNAT family N-acetyltransferase [Planktothrix sp. FACHB-1355]|uniref:GNAT family N-acetyltransferase n=2 Tax=Cyanophyceae TaxID=3028117 RepID=A0A926ZHD6_9CYAN|nr:GNAT family N-acetyltransferase [Planktothrix sp. FACHB-1355]MBD2182915.1 GNAT family N-acetyltransferase [Aerosakkonema funiforme FACHB-1375]MBD3557373.1 GNAT family N-acetyltransferase [Planktothrix sp. FACHB-1355]